MDRIYRLIVRWPGRSVLLFLGGLFLISTLPVSWLQALTPWAQSPDWARTVFQLGALVVVLVGGVVPITKWFEDRTQKVKDDKPIVVSDLVEGTYKIRNLGNAPAVNVWLLVDAQDAPVALGSLDVRQERAMPALASTLVQQATPQRQDSCRSLAPLISGASRQRLGDETLLTGL